MPQSQGPALRERVYILVTYLLLLYVLDRLLTQRWVPKSGGEGIWLVSAVGFVSFNFLSAPFFVKPRDSLARALAVLLLLLALDLSQVSLFARSLNIFRWFCVGLSLLTVFLAVLATVLHGADSVTRPRAASMSRVGYRLSTNLGKGAVIFTPPALISIFGFHQGEPTRMLVLGFVWVALVVVQPVELVWRCVNDVRRLRHEILAFESVGLIDRIDSPNIVRVKLALGSSWSSDDVYVACLADSKQVYVLPLFKQIRNDIIVGTGLCYAEPKTVVTGATAGGVYRPAEAVTRLDLIRELSKVDIDAGLAGFVVEESTIAAIRFEVIGPISLREGNVVFCRQASEIVYYQILEAETTEESFERNPHGTHVVTAAQIGVLNDEGAFTKYAWLPEMNAPVFLPTESINSMQGDHPTDEFALGIVPGTKIVVRARFNELLEFHTAILGATGTGKTELVFDIIRQALKLNTKVFCVDFTGEYRERLKDLNPESLGLSEEDHAEMSDLVEQIETGAYSAADEKKALKDFVTAAKPNIEKQVSGFLVKDGPGLALFELQDIANTRATLRTTELYLSEIFKWARKNRKARRVLLVLEEAHTVIPEMNLFGFDRGETLAVIGRMAQIALQGRKFGVGLLIVSQRTALVSKTVLSQCGTSITFSLVDKTSLEYLSSVYSAEHVKVLPNLLFLQALAHGKGIRSERPMVVEVPYDQAKKDASELLNKTVPTQPEPGDANIPQQEEPRADEPVGFEPITEDDIPF